MTPGTEEKIIQLLAAQTGALDRIARALEAMAIAQAPAPNFKRPLAAFRDFDFSEIGAVVKQRDNYGARAVEWGGYTWTRRNAGDKKKGLAIWFSRVAGGTVEGADIKWIRLITFKDAAQAEPLDEKIAERVNGKEADHPTT